MTTPSHSTASEIQDQLIRRGTRVSERGTETIVRFDAPEKSSLLLPAFFTNLSYVVPQGPLRVPWKLDGIPITAQNAREPGARAFQFGDFAEQVTLYPELYVLGVLDPNKVVAVLHPRYEDQIGALRNLVNGIFERNLSRPPDMDEMRALTEARKASIIQTVRAELGLEMDFHFRAEPKVLVWIASLMTLGAQRHTMTFNPELPAYEFKLSFTMHIKSADVFQAHRILRRINAGQQPAEEVATLFRRVFDIVTPAVRSVVVGNSVWNRELIREMAIDGFAKVVERRIANEFGYIVLFSEFSPELNSRMVAGFNEADDFNSTLTRLKSRRGLLKELEDKRDKMLIDTGGDIDPKALQKVNDNLRVIQEEVTTLANEVRSAPKHDFGAAESLNDSVTAGLKLKFRQALLEDRTDEDRRHDYSAGTQG